MDDTGDLDDKPKISHDKDTIQRLKIVISLSDAKSVARDQYSRVVDRRVRLSPTIGVWDRPQNFRDLKNYDNPFAWAVESYSEIELARLCDAARSSYSRHKELYALRKSPPPDNSDQNIYFLYQPDPFREIPPSGAVTCPETFDPHIVGDSESLFVSNIKNCYLDKPSVGVISVGCGRGRRWARVLLSCKELDREKLPEETDPKTLATEFKSPLNIQKQERFEEISQVPFYRTLRQGPGWYAIRRLCQNEWCQNLAHIAADIVLEERDRCPGGSHCQHTRQCMNVGPKFFTKENKSHIKRTLKKIRREIGFWKACVDYLFKNYWDSNVAVPMLSDTGTMTVKTFIRRPNKYVAMTAIEVPPDIKSSQEEA